MSEYKHRMTLVVPEAMMSQANQLALIVGESVDDVNTFTTANWQDSDGNLYAVCSTVIKPIVLDAFGAKLSEQALPAHAQDADVQAAQEALDRVVMYSEGVTASTDKIVVGIDIEPTDLLKAVGVAVIESEPL